MAKMRGMESEAYLILAYANAAASCSVICSSNSKLGEIVRVIDMGTHTCRARRMCNHRG